MMSVRLRATRVSLERIGDSAGYENQCYRMTRVGGTLFPSRSVQRGIPDTRIVDTMTQESFRSYSCSVKPILALQWVPVFCVAKADESETTLDVFNQSPDFRWSFYCMCRGIRMLRDKRMSCPPHPLLGWTCG